MRWASVLVLDVRYNERKESRMEKDRGIEEARGKNEGIGA